MGLPPSVYGGIPATVPLALQRAPAVLESGDLRIPFMVSSPSDVPLEKLRRSAASEDVAQRTAALRACSRGLLGYVYAPCD